MRNVGGGDPKLRIFQKLLSESLLNLSTSLENVCVCVCVCACVEMASGLLYFKKNSRVGLSSWKQGFFRLIDGTLHQFGSEVRETHTHTHGAEQCGVAFPQSPPVAILQKPMNKEHLEGTYYTNSEMTLNEFEFEFDKSQLVTLNEFDKSQCD